MAFPAPVLERAANIELVAFDVDGVLTDGKLYYADDGRELKAFHVQDGAALKLMLSHGIVVAIITGRTSSVVSRRAQELGIDHVYQGVMDKGAALAELTATVGTTLERAAYVGDDLPDLGVFDKAGMAISVPNAHPVAAAAAHYVTLTAGGAGAAREIAQLFLEARGTWPYG
ncbi:MAG: HAD hydrolase family protein [Pseudomonadales bacterium]|nr:HAD hydrolase family protein [Pseudomonadales bacterium]NIX06895.1 HAD hydrolase family protein [Pseudomonadales bacterium]